MKYDTILETTHTPRKINRLFGTNHNVWIKLERANPGASIKDRIALSMIEDRKRIVEKKTASLSKRPRDTIGLAMVAAVKATD
jgi:cysteine synthase A